MASGASRSGWANRRRSIERIHRSRSGNGTAPNSVGTTRVNPMRYRHRRPGRAGSSSASASTRVGDLRASSRAILPPIELPTTRARSTSSSSNRWRTTLAKNLGEYSVRGFSDSPWPGRSGTITRWDAARGASSGTHEIFDPPSPWRSTTGRPFPTRYADRVSPSASTSTWSRSDRVRARRYGLNSVCSRTARSRFPASFSRRWRKASGPVSVPESIASQVEPSAQIVVLGAVPGPSRDWQECPPTVTVNTWSPIRSSHSAARPFTVSDLKRRGRPSTRLRTAASEGAAIEARSGITGNVPGFACPRPVSRRILASHVRPHPDRPKPRRLEGDGGARYALRAAAPERLASRGTNGTAEPGLDPGPRAGRQARHGDVRGRRGGPARVLQRAGLRDPGDDLRPDRPHTAGGSGRRVRTVRRRG